MLAPWKISYDSARQHIKKQRHYFANKSPYSQSYGFSSSLYGCESWIVKKAEHQRTDDFELWCWRRLLRVPWTARRSNQAILKEIIPECSWKEWCCSWNFNTLATWCKELTYWKRPRGWERLKVEEKRVAEDEMVEWHHWLYGREFEQALGFGVGQVSLACFSPWGHKEFEMTERLNNNKDTDTFWYRE